MTTAIRKPILDYRRDSYLDRSGETAAVPETGVTGRDGGSVIDCGVGYGRWGTSKRACDAMRRLDPRVISAYPEPFHDNLLKPVILDRFKARGVSGGELFFGHGSFNLSERVIHKFLTATTMLGIGPQFAEIPSEFVAAGGVYEPLPLVPDTMALPVAALERRLARGGVSVLFVDNPNNPLGVCFPLDALARLAAACERHDAVLLVDEAWGDFVDEAASAIHLVSGHDSVIAIRSFSKALGLAAERVGYMAMSPRLARYYRGIDVPFEPGLVGAVMARETLADREFVARVRAESRAAKAAIVAVLVEVGVQVLPTDPAVSILSVHVPGRDLVTAFAEVGVTVQAGSSFVATHPDWNDSFCRLRVVEPALVDELCRRIRALGLPPCW